MKFLSYSETFTHSLQRPLELVPWVHQGQRSRLSFGAWLLWELTWDCQDLPGSWTGASARVLVPTACPCACQGWFRNRCAEIEERRTKQKFLLLFDIGVMKGQYVTFQNTFLWWGCGGRENYSLRKTKYKKRKCKRDLWEQGSFFLKQWT